MLIFCLQFYLCRRGDSKEEISKVLGDPARVFTTRCVMHELRKLGSDYAATRQACKRYALHHCGHEDPVSAAECMMSQIEGGNKEHFFIASQDRTLQRKVMSMPGGAVMFATVNGVSLETPSETQKKHAQFKGEAKERRSILPLKRKAEEGSGDDDEESGERRRSEGEKSAFRRQKAKGPNPLSIKKKKKAAPSGGNAPSQAEQQQDQEQNKAKRQRRRRGGDEGGGSD